MTLHGEEIGTKPTLTQIEIYICEKGLYCNPKDVYEYWEKKNWKTKKGVPVKTVETACNVYNGVITYHELKRKEREWKKIKDLEFTPYKKQLKDKRWDAFRSFILNVRGKRCERCGAKNNLQIHHLHYNKGCKAWEYNCNEVIVVCEDCHKKIHNIT